MGLRGIRGEFFARGARGLGRKENRQQPGYPSCSRRPHFGKCSLDARSERQPDYCLEVERRQPVGRARSNSPWMPPCSICG